MKYDIEKCHIMAALKARVYNHYKLLLKELHIFNEIIFTLIIEKSPNLISTLAIKIVTGIIVSLASFHVAS